MRGTRYWESAAIPELYEWFASEAEPSSPAWARVSRQVAATPSIAALLDSLPPAARQPNLFLASIKRLGGPLDADPSLPDWVRRHWPTIEQLVTTRFTQTNEVGRCAVLAPLLASLPQPLALVEVGMSAGLGLFPDLYGYRWLLDDGTVVTGGPPSEVTIECRVTGDGLPLAVPRVAWRAGIDRNPLDPSDREDSAWLRALVWPGESAREERLAAALRTVAEQDALRVAGDITDALPAVVAAAPRGTTVVVVHSATLAYLPRERREKHLDLVSRLGVHWISNEGPKVVPVVRDALPTGFTDDPRPSFVLALDGRPLARVGSHGQWLEWL
ncbi:MAG TPA: DUF2332 domain-containing protein [Propionibacteriaceae bacterium]|nr:DUF2332 domain-containing protein [Propionibacteriaceae bacterium]